jgi:hypothetical protein
VGEVLGLRIILIGRRAERQDAEQVMGVEAFGDRLMQGSGLVGPDKVSRGFRE